MSDRLRSMSDPELGRALAAAVPAEAWPPTPELVRGVVAAIGTAGRGSVASRVRVRVPSRRRRLVLLAAALLALAAAAAATKLVIDLGAISIQTIEGPTAPPTGSGLPDLGRPVTLERAARVAGFEPLVPAALGAPDRVWVDRGPVSFEEDAPRIVMVWRPGPGLPRIAGSAWGAVLMEFEGTVDAARKYVFNDTGTLEEVFVDGRSAFWTTGEHRIDLLTDEGVVAVRVRGRVLLWTDAGLALRLETALPRATAIRIAESL